MNGSGRRLWIGLAAVGVALDVAAMVGVALTPVPVIPNVYILGLLAFPLVGGLVVARQPANLVGRLMVMAGGWNAVGVAGNTYFWMSLETSLPPSDLAPWLSLWVYWPALTLMVIIVGVFPSGRLASAWLRPILWIGAIAVALLTVMIMFAPVPINTVFFGDQSTNPWALEDLAPVAFVDQVLPVLAIVMTGIAVVDLVGRWRHSAGVERLQMRWVGLGLLAIVILGAVGVVGEAAGLSALLIALWLSFGALPTAIGLAVIRYRLYDIDRLLSRTVSYALVAGLLAAVFAAIVIGLPRLLSVPDDNSFLVAGATLAVAGLFNPFRGRIQARVDRRFNRSHYDAQQEVDHFAALLRTDLELNDLTRALLTAVGVTMQPVTASVWIHHQPR